MSRLSKSNPHYEIAYGKDIHVGFFIEVYDLTKPGDDNMILRKTEYEEGAGIFGIEDIVRIALDYGFDLSDELTI